MFQSPLIVGGACILGGLGGNIIGQTMPISDTTTFSLAIVVSGIATAFAVGGILTGIKKDLKFLKSRTDLLEYQNAYQIYVMGHGPKPKHPVVKEDDEDGK